MRSKTILSIIAFVTAFGISLAVTPRTATQTVAPLYQPKQCTETSRSINRLLEQDIANGLIRDRKMVNVRKQGFAYGSPVYHLNLAAAVSSYSFDSNSIDTTGLPADFLSAWRDHMNAWEAYSEFLKENVDSEGKLLRERSFYRSSASYDREISRTWYEVLQIARDNGAEIPAGAYY